MTSVATTWQGARQVPLLSFLKEQLVKIIANFSLNMVFEVLKHMTSCSITAGGDGFAAVARCLLVPSWRC